MDEELLSAVRQYVRYMSTGAIIPDRKEFALISQIHDEYQSIRRLMDNKMCIISPIRAIVLNHDPSNTLKIARLYHDLGVEWGRDPECMVVSSVKDMNLYLKSTKIVGYMVGFRMESKEKYRIGCSLCMPQDYHNFNKEIGVVLAFDDLHLEDETVPIWKQSVLSETADSIIPQGYDRFYLFPFNIAMQYNNFSERCNRYFCKGEEKE